MYNNRNIIIWLNYIGISNIMINKIVNNTGKLEDILTMSLEKLSKELKLSKIASEKIILRKKDLEIDLNKLKSFNIVTIYDIDYPDKLKTIDDRPNVLYYKGDIKLLDRLSIGIVGTRKPTSYGFAVCEKFTSDLINEDVVIVSGLATGIDTIAHRKSLSLNGKTIAVLGCGINVIYPRKNEKLYIEIENKGLLLTEFPPDTEPLSYNFPQRNRIISALSKGVIVIEAKDRSGSIITARIAAEQGREVFAVPGNINSIYSIGSNKLIRDGAIPLLEFRDIMDSIPEIQVSKSIIVKNKRDELSDLEQNIVTTIERGPISSDEISRILNINVKDLNGILTVLELKGVIKEINNSSFILS